MIGWIEVRPPAYSKQPILRIALPSEIVSRLALLPADDWIGSMVEAVARSAGDRFRELVRELRGSTPHTLAVFTVLEEGTETISIQSTRNLGTNFWHVM